MLPGGRDSPTPEEPLPPKATTAAVADLHAELLSRLAPANFRALLDAELSARLAPLEERIARLEFERQEVAQLGSAGNQAAPAPGQDSRTPLASSGDVAVDIANPGEGVSEVEVGEAGIVEVRPIKETVWECVVLCGMPAVGAAGSCAMLLSILMNLVLQSLFCFVAMYGFTEDTLPSVESARRWRLTDAHSLTYMDQSSFVSLAARVCGEDSSLTFANSQNSVLMEIREYMNPISLFGTEFCSVGQLLCVVVLFVWLLFVAQEVQDSLAFASTVCALPRSRRTILVQDGDTYALESISAKRTVFLMGVVLFRLGIVIVLGYAGSLWLCNTRELKDLVLNAAALAFVTDLDELIFSTLTPLSASVLVERLEPLRRPKGLRWRGLGLHSIFGFAACVAFTCFFLFGHALPMGDRMIAIEKELCKRGSVDFVVEHNRGLGLPLAVATASFEDTAPEVDSWFKHVVAEIIDSHSPMVDGASTNVTSARPVASKQSFFSYLAQGINDQGFPSCNDILDTPNVPDIEAHLTWLRYNYDNLTATTCQDFVEHCGDQEGFALRYVCPRTCGCADPYSGLYYQSGCPDVCSRERTAHLRKPFCEDLSNESSPAHLDGIRSFIERFSEAYGNPFPPGFLQEGGCDDLIKMADMDPYYWTKHSLCSASIGTKGSLQSFCPVACGCAESDGENSAGAHCPESCARGAGAAPNVSSEECVMGLCPNGELMGSALAYPGQVYTCGLMDSMFYSGAYTDNMCQWTRGSLQQSCCSGTPCVDQNAEAVIFGAGLGYTISGCSEVPSNFCQDLTVKSICPVTCGECNATVAACPLCPSGVLQPSVTAYDAGDGSAPVSCQGMQDYVNTQGADQCAGYQSAFAHCCSGA
jgi:hypothetical protein